MNFGGTSKRIIMMEYFYRKQTTQIGTLWLVQGLADSYQSQQKNVFRDDYISNDLEIIWNEINIQNKDIVIRIIYITPGNKNQLKILDKQLERHRGKNIILLGDFNSRSNTSSKNIQ